MQRSESLDGCSFACPIAFELENATIAKINAAWIRIDFSFHSLAASASKPHENAGSSPCRSFISRHLAAKGHRHDVHGTAKMLTAPRWLGSKSVQLQLSRASVFRLNLLNLRLRHLFHGDALESDGNVWFTTGT
ncbi:hypothetical protein [Rhizobium leguminosarum]|uniref:hypothetical protein n=1 Tax=Rhizobium leguminosarum TaxID=384 RepID=UPI001C93E8E2|nr:hypothetical protein [Rhizobium leguminosarum]MBY5810573.1 hypothetical protein [Rhizobium leguminosarum]